MDKYLNVHKSDHLVRGSFFLFYLRILIQFLLIEWRYSRNIEKYAARHGNDPSIPHFGRIHPFVVYHLGPNRRVPAEPTSRALPETSSMYDSFPICYQSSLIEVNYTQLRFTVSKWPPRALTPHRILRSRRTFIRLSKILKLYSGMTKIKTRIQLCKNKMPRGEKSTTTTNAILWIHWLNPLRLSLSQEDIPSTLSTSNFILQPPLPQLLPVSPSSSPPSAQEGFLQNQMEVF